MYPLQNLAISSVATAPSPATSGVTLVLAAGEGARFADPASVGSYPATVWASGSLPTPATAEIVLVTAKSTDTLTLVRAQESTSARTVVVGDRIAATITAAALSQFSRNVTVDDQALWTPSSALDYEFDATTSSPPSGWSWVNQGTGTYSEAKGAGVITHPGQAANDNLKLLVQPLSAFASTWTAFGKASISAVLTNNASCGLALYDSGTGKVISLCNGINSSVVQARFDSWVNTTTWNGGIPFSSTEIFRYARIRKNSGTSYDFSVSADGVGWIDVTTANNVSTWMTPTHIGVVVQRGSASTATAAFHWFRVR